MPRARLRSSAIASLAPSWACSISSRAPSGSSPAWRGPGRGPSPPRAAAAARRRAGRARCGGARPRRRPPRAPGWPAAAPYASAAPGSRPSRRSRPDQPATAPWPIADHPRHVHRHDEEQQPTSVSGSASDRVVRPDRVEPILDLGAAARRHDRAASRAAPGHRPHVTDTTNSASVIGKQQPR